MSADTESVITARPHLWRSGKPDAVPLIGSFTTSIADLSRATVDGRLRINYAVADGDLLGYCGLGTAITAELLAFGTGSDPK